MKNLGDREQEVGHRVGAREPIISFFATLKGDWEILSATFVEKEQRRENDRGNTVPGLALEG